MSTTPRLFVIVGGPGSGKDDLIQAVRDMGARHASIVPKHTSRDRRPSDEDEMVCPGDDGFDLDHCEICYESHGDRYGIQAPPIWTRLASGISQVVVVSQITGINQLRARFGELLVLVYVHSEMTQEEYQAREGSLTTWERDAYAERRAADYQQAFQVYVDNVMAFDHVLIGSATKEDIFDQLFRLFRAYETGRVHVT